MSRFTAVEFDWAGITLDFGPFTPMGLFIKAFEATRGRAATNADVDNYTEFVRRLDAT